MLTKGYSCAEAGRKKETEMKLGFITSILEDFTYEEMIDFASEHGFELSLIHISEPTRP